MVSSSLETTLITCIVGSLGGYVLYKLIKTQERNTTTSASQDTVAASNSSIDVGCSVRITDHNTLNGKSGTVVSKKDDQWVIVLDEDNITIKVNPQNCILIADEETRLQHALTSKDRDTIRSIMKSRQERNFDSATLSEEKSTVAFPQESFCCPICRNLLYKPCINSCGHAFCFWCLHHAMNGIGASACPICRTPYNRFAEPLELLHRFLVRAFPEETTQREEETAEQEKSVYGNARAPTIPLEREGKSKHLVGPVDAADLFCVSCHNLVKDPVVSVCGHISCMECVSSNKSGQCSQCCTPIVENQEEEHHLKICSLLLPLLDSANGVDKATLDSLTNKAKRSVAYSAQSRVVELPEIYQDSKDGFIHFFCGCDGCGQYPLKGVAFQCLDCPESIGFDLCKSCFLRGVHLQERNSYGRFNQSHAPSHKFHERPQTSTALHELMRLHPEMTPAQIMQFVDFHTSGDGEEEGGPSRR
jgi:hypothetical protein